MTSESIRSWWRRCRGPRRGELEQRAALEVHAVVQPADRQRHHADQQDQPGDHVEDLPAADEVNRHLAAVQPSAEVAEPGHHASLGLVRGFAADRAGGSAGGWPGRPPGPAPRSTRPEPLRIQAGQLVALAEELGPGQQGDHRLGEQEHHDDVDQRGQAERVREALHVADGEDVQQRRGQERDRVGDQDRPPGAGPAAFDGRPQRPALPDLVAQSLEVDHERVGRDADGHHQAGDAGQGQGVALVLAQQDDFTIGQQRRDGQAGHRHEPSPR